MASVFINPVYDDAPYQAGDLVTFFHAQRTGGSALRHLLGAAVGKPRVYCTQFAEDFVHWENVEPARLDGVLVFAGHSNFQDRDLSRRLLPVSLMRHPVYRNISLYYYARKFQNQFLHPLTEGRGLEEFYDVASAKKPVYFNDVLCRRVCGEPSAAKAIALIESRYFVVGATERLGDFVSALFGKLGVAIPEVPAKQSDAEQYREELANEGLVARILANNPEDVALFDYLNERYFGLPAADYRFT